MITGNRATPDTTGEILSDIERQGVHATQIIDRHRTMSKVARSIRNRSTSTVL